eukprot:scaffold93122_cov32-Tisochrysis_lutea.AAC.4
MRKGPLYTYSPSCATSPSSDAANENSPSLAYDEDAMAARRVAVTRAYAAADRARVASPSTNEGLEFDSYFQYDLHASDDAL